MALQPTQSPTCMHIYIDDYDDVVGSNLMQVAG